MGLYFSINPGELRGNVLELGSGVGLGGILSNVATNVIYDDSSVGARRNITLTDVNEDVLDMLQQNVMGAASRSSPGFFKNEICIRKLDWYDFLGDLQTSSCPEPTSNNDDDRCYDTIIASDCAYLHSQIVPLSETISKLLGNSKDGKKRLHMFTPYNRGVVHELIRELRRKGMHVDVEDIEMSKYRIKPEGGRGAFCRNSGRAFEGRFWNDEAAREPLRDAMTCGVSKFLHITAWHKTGLEIFKAVDVAKVRITDID